MSAYTVSEFRLVPAARVLGQECDECSTPITEQDGRVYAAANAVLHPGCLSAKNARDDAAVYATYAGEASSDSDPELDGLDTDGRPEGVPESGFSRAARFVQNHPYVTATVIGLAALGIAAIVGPAKENLQTVCYTVSDGVRRCAENVLANTEPVAAKFSEFVKRNITTWVPSGNMVTKSYEQVNAGAKVILSNYTRVKSFFNW